MDTEISYDLPEHLWLFYMQYATYNTNMKLTNGNLTVKIRLLMK